MHPTASGESETVTDPKGTITKTFYDDLGRMVYIAENHADFDPATSSTIGDATDPSKDRVTKTRSGSRKTSRAWRARRS